MESISEPYVIHYPQIVAVTDEAGSRVEVVEFFDCIGGAMWSKLHYARSPIVESVRNVGGTMRYVIRPGQAELQLEGSRFPAGISGVAVGGREIAVSYIGMGGGGVGVTSCRSTACGVLRSECDPSGGGKVSRSTIWVPRRGRVLIGVDDTDTPEEGATWTLTHNIAKAVEDDHSRYLSHTIVQLFPVPYRTKNCVAIVCEFATDDPGRRIASYHRLLEKYTLSDKTGMAAYTGFAPGEPLIRFGRAVKRGEVSRDQVDGTKSNRLEIVMDGRGIIGAIAAIPFFTQYGEALALCGGPS
jgi:methanogenesis imperfect marker protein 11